MVQYGPKCFKNTRKFPIIFLFFFTLPLLTKIYFGKIVKKKGESSCLVSSYLAIIQLIQVCFKRIK